MKNQTNRIFLMFAVIGFALFIGGCQSNAPQNTQTTSNQNTADTNASNRSEPSQEAAPPPCTEDAISQEINQFSTITTISLDSNHKLTLKGYVYGNNAFVQLVTSLDKFRSEQCVKVISFEGGTQAADFEWCKNINCLTPSPTRNCHVDSIVNTSRMKPQIPHNLTYTISPNSGVLEFKGYAGDIPNKGQFKSLFARLIGDMNIGCISKVVFAPGSAVAKKELLRSGFELTLCEPPLCEKGNECEFCMVLDANSNTNVNVNSNANVP